MSYQFKCVAAISLSLALAGPASAISIGEMHATSAVGEPLRLEMELVDLQAARLSDIKLSPASTADYNRLGIAMPAKPLTLSFDVSGDPNTRVFAVVRSAEVQTMPDVSLLLQISVPGSVRLQQVATTLASGHPDAGAASTASQSSPVSVAELPDGGLAVTSSADAPAVSNVAALPVGSGSNATPPVIRPDPASHPADISDSPSAYSGSKASGVADGHQRVEPGQSLSALAADWRAPGLSSAQKQQLLAQANPAAFIGGDINRLRSGAVVKFPALDAVPTADTAKSWLGQHLSGSKLDAAAPAAAGSKLDQPVIAADSKAPAAKTASDVKLTLVAPGASDKGHAAGAQSAGSGKSAQVDLAAADASHAALLKEREALLAKIKRASGHQAEQDARLKVLDERLAAFDQRADQSSANKTDTPTPAPADTDGALSEIKHNLRHAVHTLSHWAHQGYRYLATNPFVAAMIALVLVFLLALSALWRALSRRREQGTAAVTPVPAPRQAPVLSAAAAAAVVPAAVHPGFIDLPEISNEELLAEGPDEYDFLSDSEAEAHQTRLDLAQAYIDMGEPAQARYLLTVVQDGGTPAQRLSASHMLQHLS